MNISKCLMASMLLSGLSLAQGVPDGSDWLFPDGSSATVDVADTTPTTEGTVTIQVIDDSGHTPATTGVEGSDSSSTKPTCESAPAKSTGGGNTFRIKKGNPGKSKLQKLNSNGEWVSGRPVRRKKGGVGNTVFITGHNQGPENVGTLPVTPPGP